MKKTLLLIMSCWFITKSLAQNSINQQFGCGAMQDLQRQIYKNPQRIRELNAMEKQIAKFVAERERNRKSPGKQRIQDPVITIPVAFHIVGSAAQQVINDIDGQIAAMNNHFNSQPANTHPFYGVSSKTRIQFCKAQVITRATTSAVQITPFNDQQLLSYAPTNGTTVGKYLNVWVCDLSEPDPTKLTLGYATFPAGNSETNEADGIVVDYSAFGANPNASYTRPTNKQGKTLTHEAGHWLGLYHPWGDDTNPNCLDINNSSDYISDTPISSGPIYNCPTVGTSNCSGNGGNMFQNYMDYAGETCKDMFTVGQADRMIAQFDVFGFRRYILRTPTCNATTGCPVPNGLDARLYMSGSNPYYTLYWMSTGLPAGSEYEYQYVPVANQFPNAGGTTVPTNVGTAGPLTLGVTYKFRVRSKCLNPFPYPGAPATYTYSAWSMEYSFTVPAAPSNPDIIVGNADSGYGNTNSNWGSVTSANGDTPYATHYKGQKVQYIITREQLHAEGFPGTLTNLDRSLITSLYFNLHQNATGISNTSWNPKPMDNFMIKMMEIDPLIDEFETLETAMSGADGEFLPTHNAVIVYSGNNILPANGTTQFPAYNFSVPFAYSGNNNLLIEITYYNSTNGVSTQVQHIQPTQPVAGQTQRRVLRQTLVYKDDKNVSTATKGRALDWRPIIGLTRLPN